MERQCGFSKFEFLVAVAVIGVISAIGLDRLNELQELGEKTAVETTILNIQTGLRYAIADRVIRGEEGTIAAMVGSNPMQWLERPPAGYEGECAMEPDPRGGRWCFDVARRELVYQPALARNLTIGGGRRFLRWRIAAPDGTDGTGRVGYVRLSPVVSYRWFPANGG